MKHTCFYPADLLLPDFSSVDGTRYACIACDQFTAEPAYWEEASSLVGDSPSALRLILPECYLDSRAERTPAINAEMRRLLQSGFFREYPASLLYLERTCPDGRVRRGLIGAVDLECYSYKKGEKPLIRATEGTVLERIPPRMEIRRDAPIELPHVMLLIDDAEQSVIEPLTAAKECFRKVYDFDLMLGGGHACGWLLDETRMEAVEASLARLADEGTQEKKYQEGKTPLLFAVGDGNHSLATAKATYEELKTVIGEEAAKAHPARFALCEVVNLHDSSLDFEPIYRVVFGADAEGLLRDFRTFIDKGNGRFPAQRFTVVIGREEREFVAKAGLHPQPVGTLQLFLDEYLKEHPEAEVDYIHDEGSLRALAERPNTMGFLFLGMDKSGLFPSIVAGGALPRKTFSMGHARDKRYYLEARRIK